MPRSRSMYQSLAARALEQMPELAHSNRIDDACQILRLCRSFLHRSCVVRRQNLLYTSLETRDEVRLEPRVLTNPAIVAPAGVGERDQSGPGLRPVGDVARNRRPASGLRRIALEGVLAYHHGQLDLGEGAQYRIVPSRRALRAWREVSRRPGTREAKPHRHDRHQGRVIEFQGCDPHPRTKPLPTRVVERGSGLVGPPPRSLPDDQDLRLCTDLEERLRPQREMGRTDSAAADVLQESGQLAIRRHEALMTFPRTAH